MVKKIKSHASGIQTLVCMGGQKDSPAANKDIRRMNLEGALSFFSEATVPAVAGNRITVQLAAIRYIQKVSN